MAMTEECACRTCVYSFPAALADSGMLYSCGITSKPVNAVVVRCGAYRRKTEASQARKFPKVAPCPSCSAKVVE